MVLLRVTSCEFVDRLFNCCSKTIHEFTLIRIKVLRFVNTAAIEILATFRETLIRDPKFGKLHSFQ
jgi:hypothetical protein